MALEKVYSGFKGIGKTSIGNPNCIDCNGKKK